ncbi:MAG TPA: ABC transporter ATP-binding protein [Actinomycetes bacterium]|jgi:putative ABC transport system ATP-binding protein|nr:ABC transporter ATP-binding protein [Actinomycetes bacterium]
MTAEVMTDVAIRLEGVSKTYGEGDVAVHALRGIDVDIRRGEFVVILGPSGSGKTTLLNVIGGIEPASSGLVVVDGRSLGELDERGRTAFRRRRVGFVFQFFNLIPTLTARENVELVLELTGRAVDPAALEEVLGEVGLAERADHFPAQLSGGEQQRVAIARAIAKDPAILLCDEPTGAVDLDAGRRVLALLRKVSTGRRRTVLLVTHNSAIAGIADRVVRMRSGELVSDERVERPIDPEELQW